MKKKLPPFLAGIFTALLVSSLAISALAATGALTIEVNPINVQVNGQTFQPKDAAGQAVPVFAYNGTTYAPLRALAETFGLKVGYDATTNMATVGDATPTKTPDATADYSTWTAEEEKAYQEFKGMWEVEKIDDNYTKQAFAWYKNQNDVALAKQVIKSLDKETVYKQMTRFVCETSYVGIRFNSGDKDGCLFVVTREGVGYDWVYQNGKVMN